MSAPTVDEFRAKVLVILAESMQQVLPYGFVGRRVTEEYEKALRARDEQIAAILAMHENRYDEWCSVCDLEYGWPCPTVKALGGQS